MKQIIDNVLYELAANGNLREIPGESGGRIDFCSNDYLGIASRNDFKEEFFSTYSPSELLMSASASRLLANCQSAFSQFESTLESAYGQGRKTSSSESGVPTRALLFNSGYHANVGIISAFASMECHVIADKLVHASIIDGIKLSGLPFDRFRHNDYTHLERLAEKIYPQNKRLLIVAESVYSMDGDRADIDRLAQIKKRFPGSLLYIDEAHAVGVEGSEGLGFSAASNAYDDVDVVIGTLGKALASTGAYAITKPEIREFLVNKSRSLIFSTAIPPVNILWSDFIFKKMMKMDAERANLKTLAALLSSELEKIGITTAPSHIQPVIIGDPKRSVEIASKLREDGFDVLPIRTPTVPPKTDRLRISLNAALKEDDVINLVKAIKKAL